MDPQQLKLWADEVSADDLVVSRDAVRNLKSALTPAALLAAWSDGQQRGVLEHLLAESRMVANAAVYSVVCSCITGALVDGEVGSVLLTIDADRTLPHFLFDSLASEEIEIAAQSRPAVLALMRLLHTNRPLAGEIGGVVDDKLNAEKALRLFDCDAAESDDNFLVYSFLKEHTTRVEAILAATAEAFDTDPLLLANYLVVAGVICQRQAPPPQLIGRVADVLGGNGDALYMSFVCRFCSIALLHREENAKQFAAEWVHAALAPERLPSYSEDEADAVLDLVGSTSTTRSGWNVVAPVLPLDWISAQLQSRSDVLQLAALRFLRTLLLSPYFDSSAVNVVPVLRDAWQLRASLEEPVREAVWVLVRAIVGNPRLRDEFAAAFASYISGGPREEGPTIREMQLKVAEILVACSALPDAMKQALESFKKRGVYPPGSAGVAEMTKD